MGEAPSITIVSVLCGCGCGRAVRRAGPGGRTRPRIVDGVRWKWYASRACAGRVHGKQNHPFTASAAEKWRQRQWATRTERLRQACAALVDARGRVAVSDLLALFTAECRRDYSRGFSAGRSSARRTVVAATGIAP